MTRRTLLQSLTALVGSVPALLMARPASPAPMEKLSEERLPTIAEAERLGLWFQPGGSILRLFDSTGRLRLISQTPVGKLRHVWLKEVANSYEPGRYTAVFQREYTGEQFICLVEFGSNGEVWLPVGRG